MDVLEYMPDAQAISIKGFCLLGGRIRDLGKGAFGMWAFIAHGGLSKPTVGFQNLFRASKNMGAIFLKKKSACGNVPTSSGLPKIWGPFF